MKSYASGVKQYINFCSKFGQSPLPVVEDVMSAFVATLAEEGICYASIRTYLSAVRHFQIASGQGDPGNSQMAHLEYVLKGVRRDGAYRSAEPRKGRQPITPAILKKLFLEWKGRPTVKDAKMLWATACMAFFGFLRVGEFTSPSILSFDEKVHRSVADISMDHPDSPSMVYVCLKQSKTDQLRKSVSIVLGKTDQPPLCPVSAIFKLSGGEREGSRTPVCL